jgi:5-methyltetrahydrofolate--homocysteine methyltransferase
MALEAIFDHILTFDDEGTARCVQAELDQGTDVMAILNDGLIAGLDEAMKKGMAVLRPHLECTGIAPSGCIVIGTVKGDQHDIGKNLVAMMLECAGFKVIDLGKDVDSDKFVRAAQQNRADLVALSALITSALASMKTAVSSIRSQDNAPKTLIGGAPVTQAFADRIGADGYSPDAVGAVAVARHLIKSRT